MVRVHFGCGGHIGPSWENYDMSPMMRIERLPGGAALKKLAGGGNTFPREVRPGDITKGPLVGKGTATAAYASHVLEHLTLEDAKKAIANTYDMLAPGGVFRLIVPDLEWRARVYLEDLSRKDPEAASNFLRYSILGQEERRRGVVAHIRKALSGSSHLWMWDFVSMGHALESVGFVNVRRCGFGDATDAAFSEVEYEPRFWGTIDEATKYPELAVEAVKP